MMVKALWIQLLVQTTKTVDSSWCVLNVHKTWWWHCLPKLMNICIAEMLHNQEKTSMNIYTTMYKHQNLHCLFLHCLLICNFFCQKCINNYTRFQVYLSVGTGLMGEHLLQCSAVQALQVFITLYRFKKYKIMTLKPFYHYELNYS